MSAPTTPHAPAPDADASLGVPDRLRARPPGPAEALRPPPDRGDAGHLARPGHPARPGDPARLEGRPPRRTAPRPPGGVSQRIRRALLPRLLHPAAWWAWSLGAAVAASRTTNPFLLLLLIAVVIWVVGERREPGSHRILAAFLAIAAFVIGFRVLVMALLGNGVVGTTVLVTLPVIPLPDWLAGIRLGGDVTAEATLYAVYQGLQLGAILVCVGAANALASPRRLLRYLPATLYDVGTALVVGLTFVPQLVADAVRVRRARQLRGHGGRGVREFGHLVIPVLAGGLDQALGLAASMESRGYGRAADADPRRQRRASAVTVLGLIGALAGCYGLLDGSTSPLLGLPLVVAGAASAAGALWYGAGRDRRTRYRREPWGAPETLIVAVALVAAVVLTTGSQLDWPGLIPPQMPVAWPQIPPLTVPAILGLGLAGVLTPPAAPYQGAGRRAGASAVRSP